MRSILIFSRSPQTRSTIAGNSSPVVAPLALSVSNSGIVPLVPASDAVKENVGTAPALPSPAAILPDQSCIESDVSLPAIYPRRLVKSARTVESFVVTSKNSFFYSNVPFQFSLIYLSSLKIPQKRCSVCYICETRIGFSWEVLHSRSFLF